MGIGIQGTKASSLFAQNALRVNSLLLNQTNGQLATGKRLYFAGIDPSGIAISQQFRSQIGGTEQAIYNTQDAINLTRTADSTLSAQSSVLGRMRDVAVRASNEATLTDADRTRLNDEFQSLKDELTRLGESSSFNTKQLTSEANPYGSQDVQATPDNNPGANPDVTIDASTANALGLAASDVSTTGGAQTAIDDIDAALEQVSNNRANLGVTENVLQYRTNDLSWQRINMSAANSRIADTDFAQTIAEYTRGLLTSKIGIAALAASNTQSGGLLKLFTSM